MVDTKLVLMGDTKNKPTVDTKRLKNMLKQEVSSIAIFSGIISAVIIGLIVRGNTEKWSPRSLMYLSFPGEILLGILKCLIIPLVISSLISSLGSLEPRISARIRGRTLIYFFSTTVLAVFTGIILTLIIRPGNKIFGNGNGFNLVQKEFLAIDIILDMIRNMFPVNLIQACFAQYSTSIKAQDYEQDLNDWKIEGQYQNTGPNMLGLVVIATVIGIVLSNMRTEGKPLFKFFESLNEITLKIFEIVIKFIPIGIMSLVSSKIISINDMGVLFNELGLFALTVLIGLFIHGLISLPAIYFIFTRNNPYIFLAKISEALATALGTGSSLATLPVTINCLENKANLNRNMVRFCAPLGSVLNMDGTALYQTVAALFLAQSHGIDIDFPKLMLILITAVITSMGTAGIPQAGLMTMALNLSVLGVPIEGLSVVIAIDWILDRFRTTLNVMGDAYGSAIVQQISRCDSQGINNELDNEIVRINTNV